MNLPVDLLQDVQEKFHEKWRQSLSAITELRHEVNVTQAIIQLLHSHGLLSSETGRRVLDMHREQETAVQVARTRHNAEFSQEKMQLIEHMIEIKRNATN